MSSIALDVLHELYDSLVLRECLPHMKGTRRAAIEACCVASISARAALLMAVHQAAPAVSLPLPEELVYASRLLHNPRARTATPLLDAIVVERPVPRVLRLECGVRLGAGECTAAAAATAAATGAAADAQALPPPAAAEYTAVIAVYIETAAGVLLRVEKISSAVEAASVSRLQPSKMPIVLGDDGTQFAGTPMRDYSFFKEHAGGSLLTMSWDAWVDDASWVSLTALAPALPALPANCAVILVPSSNNLIAYAVDARCKLLVQFDVFQRSGCAEDVLEGSLLRSKTALFVQPLFNAVETIYTTPQPHTFHMHSLDCYIQCAFAETKRASGECSEYVEIARTALRLLDSAAAFAFAT